MNMTETAIATLDEGTSTIVETVEVKQPLQMERVPDEVIFDYLASLGNDLTDKHRNQFIQICRGFNLNPFKREIYGIQYGKNFNIIVGYEVYLKRAERSQAMNGWKVWTEGTDKDLKACIQIKRKDWEEPFYHEVYIEEYHQGNSMWNSKPRTMLKKVAMAQGFRLAFPLELGGLPYTSDEMPLNDQLPQGNAQIQQAPAPPQNQGQWQQPQQCSAGQVKKINTLMSILAGDNAAYRQQLHDWCVSFAAVKIESLNDLSVQEASAAIDGLEKRINPDATDEQLPGM